MPGKYMRGALVEFQSPTFLTPLPNVIVFQYNPETITHNWTPVSDASSTIGKDAKDPLAVAGFPGESFSLTIMMDAGDTIADGNAVTAGMAQANGVYSRLAALEMLQYPVRAAHGAGLVGSVSAFINKESSGGSLFKAATQSDGKVSKITVPVVLFVWGTGRIVPIRLTGLTITEKLYDELLNPTHAEVQLTLRVLTPEELSAVEGAVGKIARTAYVYSHALRQALAAANLANAAESTIGMLPF
jgi:hypothetical protein